MKILILLFIVPISLLSQSESDKLNFCSEENLTELIGKRVKIWDDGGIYTTLNKSRSFNFPNKEMKRRAGKSKWGKFKPSTGSIGEIVFISEVDNNRVHTSKRIYILKIDNHYVPVNCGCLINEEDLDADEQEEIWKIERERKMVEYAGNCKFKTYGINHCWNRAGTFLIDSLPEIFACELQNVGIDTIMLIKYMSDNGSSLSEIMTIFWIDNGIEYAKVFRNNRRYSPEEEDHFEFKWISLLEHYYNNEEIINSGTPVPLIRMSHDMGYGVQLMSKNVFFCERLANHEWNHNTSSKNEKLIWWRLIDEKIKSCSEQSAERT